MATAQMRHGLPGIGSHTCAPATTHVRWRPHSQQCALQNIMRDPEKAAKLHRGADGPLADAWIGHIKIHPALGKREISGVACTDVGLIGPTLRDHVPDTDFGKAGRRIIEPNGTAGHTAHDTVHALQTGTAKHDDWKNVVKSRRRGTEAPWQVPAGCAPRKDLYDTFRYVPPDLAQAESAAARWMDDVAVERKRPVAIPGSRHPSAGADMLMWKPGEQVASFVPAGGKMKVAFNLHTAMRTTGRGSGFH